MSQKLFGFTILRNGLKYDYPYLESLRSLCALCDKVYLALGKSDDGTEQTLSAFENLVIIPTVWDEELRKSGLVLSAQTNIALDALRAEQAEGWGIYLQADEVLSERDFPLIRADLERAEQQGCDALSFRYLHFWQSYEAIAVDWRWYPQEVRAIRLESPARSSGDAQGFSGIRKRCETDAIVYHYGHVREANAYERKKADFNRWWHGDEEMKKVLAKGARRDKRERTVRYLGPHPSFMRGRIGERKAAGQTALVLGRPEEYGDLAERVEARLEWTSEASLMMGRDSRVKVALDPLPFWMRLFSPARSRVPRKMGSPQARDWTKDFRAILKFSEKGIAVR